MRVHVSLSEISDVEADLAVVGLYEGDELPGELASARGAGEVKGGFKKLTMVHPERPARLLVAGLGSYEEADAERLRIVAALVAKEAAKLGARSLVWQLPLEDEGDE